MRVLLNPRTAAAYGQDVLVARVANVCGLTVLNARATGYEVPPQVDFAVSMNLDERVDSEFVRNLGPTARVISHVHCRLSYYSLKQRANLTTALRCVSTGIVPARFHAYEMSECYPHVDWRVVHNGVRRAKFLPTSAAERTAFRRKLSIDGGLVFVVFVGRLENAKGLQVLESFCKQIAKTNVALVIQYPANTEKAKDAYSETANRLQGSNPSRVFLYPDTDFTTDRPIRHADLLIMPSLSEVCPLVVIESFTAGVPVLGTNATPFYDELAGLGLPPTSFHFAPLPEGQDFNVERSSLLIEKPVAENLAAQFVERASGWQSSTDEERAALSERSLKAGFDEKTMLEAFRKIYDEPQP